MKKRLVFRFASRGGGLPLTFFYMDLGQKNKCLRGGIHSRGLAAVVVGIETVKHCCECTWYPATLQMSPLVPTQIY